MRVLVIGGGAAGFFSAISCAKNNPEAEITLLEKSHKLLSKVKISGGGRCNVTHACFEDYQLVKNYPRGAGELKKLFAQFSVKDTISFFENRGVKLKAERDGRMFPITDDSQTIVDCLIREARVMGVKIMTEFAVKSVEKQQASGFFVKLRSGELLIADRIVIATGGNPNDDSYQWLRELGHNIIPPVPSLFTFNIPNSRFNGLQGISVKDVVVKINGHDLEQRGPLLITHWGFSGPAVLKLSAWAARTLYDMAYAFGISVNWIPEHSETTLRNYFLTYKNEHPKRVIQNYPLFELSKRLWERMCILSGIEEEQRWGEAPNKGINKLIEELIRCSFTIKGKTTFKEEFVTCGGINLKDIDLNSLESKKCAGIFFAGEVMDIDGITGGFNFQAAWTTGWVAGKAAGSAGV